MSVSTTRVKPVALDYNVFPPTWPRIAPHDMVDFPDVHFRSILNSASQIIFGLLSPAAVRRVPK